MHENELQRHKEERDILVEGVFTCDGTVYVALLDISSEGFLRRLVLGSPRLYGKLEQKRLGQSMGSGHHRRDVPGPRSNNKLA